MSDPNNLDPADTPAADGKSVSLTFLEARGIKRRLLAEQRTGWEIGRPTAPEDFIPRWPADPKDDADYASFLFEDYNQRRRRGEQPSIDDYAARFPQHRDSFSQLLSRRDVLFSLGAASGSEGPHLGLPEVGDEVFGFQLRGELGRGAFARVFLAEQANLAGRPVVLKISGIDGDEPYTLAQLQHTNVVPIYSVHDDVRAGLRALCMPYFGGASLSTVLKALWREKPLPTLGEELVAALRSVQTPALESSAESAKEISRVASVANGSEASETGSTPIFILSGLNYGGVAAWIVAQLADGLQHAHNRGVLHRDIKPSNILLGADGQPMLLDFNLAQKVQDTQSKAEATLGGTVAYMSPEHLRALANPSASLVRRVDQRSDVYSLGMVLFEILTGHSPFEQSASYSVLPVMIEAMALERSQAAPSVRKHQPQVPWGLESIVRKCLAPNPSDRYQHARELAEDLRRFLEDRPLRHAPELSRSERVRKWVRRHPRLTSSASVATVAVVLLIGVGVALFGVREHLAHTRAELAIKQARDRQRQYEAGTTRALCLVNTVADYQDHLREGVNVCKETLGLYGILEREDWQQDANWQQLPDSDRQRLAEDTRELLAILAWGLARLANNDRATCQDALHLLDRADAIVGLKPSKALWTDRSRFLEQLGRLDEARAARKHADDLEPVSARDHYLLATAYARKGGYASLGKAIAHLTRAVELNPRHYWSWVQRGICYQELDQVALAAGDFGTCIGLWPEHPWGYFNLGYALNQNGLSKEAIECYSAAIARNSEFLPAYVNRGLAHLDLKQYALALADFDRALELGGADASLHAGRGVALEGVKRHQEADDAFRTALGRLGGGPSAARTRIRWVYGFAVSSRLPAQAKAVFDEILREEPKQPQALYGLAMLAGDADDLSQAIHYLDQALQANSLFVDARRQRAVLWARQGDFTKASDDINSCLEREPRNGATLYAAACVAARAAERTLDASLVNQALDLLEKAILRGYGRRGAPDDPDLAAIRKNPAFRELLEKSE